MEAYQGCDLSRMSVEFIGIQEGINGIKFDMFNDLETGSTFLRCEGETVEEARDRIS